jgi:hypothetical protein
MYRYIGFGLRIASAIEFPELLTAMFEHADITITIDDIPTSIEGKRLQGKDTSYMLNEQELLFSVKDTATYYAANGNTIIISPDPNNSNMRSIRLFVLATAMAAILMQRKLMPLHASAIIKDEELIFICGDSGAGKSTTLTGLIKQGYTVFSDDITVLQNGNRVTGTASYPMIKLWEDSLVKLNLSDRSFPVRPGMDKYGIFFHETFNLQSYPVSKILLLKIGDNEEVTVNKTHGSTAFEAIYKQLYRPMLLTGPTQKKISFEVISKLLQHSDVYHISRPINCQPEALLSAILLLI